MTKRVSEAIKKARGFFEIEGVPGDFFTYASKDCMDKYNLLLFKEDIDKLSGFIGYGINDFVVICINYKKSRGHQNFTLAHEVGHLFLHRGKSISDDDSAFYSFDEIEKEANEFAKELLYPEECFERDFHHAIQNNLFASEKRAELGNYVNVLCHKYCLSFEMVLRSLLYRNKQAKEYKEIRKAIEKALGGKISKVFDKDFYTANEELPQYQKYMKPYEDLQRKVDYLMEMGKIGAATGESIKLRNGVEAD